MANERTCGQGLAYRSLAEQYGRSPSSCSRLLALLEKRVKEDQAMLRAMST